MSDYHYVRAVGQVADVDGVPVFVGIDHGQVTITAAACRLDAAKAEEFGRLFIAACWQAAEQLEQMADGA